MSLTDYKIRKLLGKGGYGSVFLGTKISNKK